MHTAYMRVVEEQCSTQLLFSVARRLCYNFYTITNACHMLRSPIRGHAKTYMQNPKRHAVEMLCKPSLMDFSRPSR
jgi:hypothetical protein